jgi:hypothetical protein
MLDGLSLGITHCTGLEDVSQVRDRKESNSFPAEKELEVAPLSGAAPS